MGAPAERKFVTFGMGEIRDAVILTAFRNSLRNRVNPDTGIAFQEDEIFRATQPGSRFYIEANSIDIYGQSMQANARFLADQLWPSRANTAFLEHFHGRLWLGKDSRLAATGASGPVFARATPGSIFVGSTTIGNPAAVVATDPNGYRYQVLHTVTTPSSGVAALDMKGIDTGFVTNITQGTILKWSSANAPLGAEPEASVADDFTGGFDVETDAEYAARVEDRMRHRPAAGNRDHFVSWAKQASNAVETAFVYPAALHAGSVVLCVTQKRNPRANPPEGPEIRATPSVGTMTDVTNFLVPPNSPVVPERAFVVVVSPSPQPADVVLRIAMARGSVGGWYDASPWPAFNTSYPEVQITNVVSDTQFDIQTDDTLPGGVSSLSGENAPQLMIWNKGISRFEKLVVDSVTVAGSTATIVLNEAPSFTPVLGNRVSPYTDRLDIIAESFESYFDELGPGEVVDLETDARGARAYRYPPPDERYPNRAGQAILSRLIDTLGGVAADAELTYISRGEPDLPAHIIDGPNMIVLGNANVFPL